MDPSNSLPQLLRQQMPVTANWAYFDHAAVAPLPEPARKSMQLWLDQATEQGDTTWPEWQRQLEATRAAAASLIGAEKGEIALVPNTTSGISVVAEGFPWQEGDNVVTMANEFPSNQYPWMNLQRRGVETRRVAPVEGRVDLGRLAEACDERTRIVAISWVGYGTGYRLDVASVAQLAHDRGALLFLDAIQGLGVFPLDVHAAGVDFLAADGHKWMLGPEGAGLLYIDQQHLEKLQPHGVGWHSVKHVYDYGRIELDFRDDAGRFEGGSHSMVGFIGLGASLKLLLELGVSPVASPVADQILAYTDIAVERLQAIGADVHGTREADHRSGIIPFTMPGHDSERVRLRCAEAGVALASRDGLIRLSPHAYNNDDDLEQLLLVLQTL
jgi:cysteine desulfurase/selenocysteine lyase